MRVFGSGFVALVTLALCEANVALAADHKITELKEAPAGLSAAVTAALNGSGYRLSDAKGVVCDVWLTKEVPLKPKFKSSLRIKYPFLPGQLIGAIRFPDGSKPNDFRGQELKPGIYTLRYGLQPDDGNHLGTSEIRDFLVGCPPKDDVDPKRVEDIQKLFKLSGTSAGTTHPAIFLLFPPGAKPFSASAVRHDNEKHLLILDVNVNGKDGDAATPVPVSLVTVGKGEG
jgi:hypothetical protein